MATVIDIHAHLVVQESRDMMQAAAEKGDVGAEAKKQVGIGISQEQADRAAVLSDPVRRIGEVAGEALAVIEGRGQHLSAKPGADPARPTGGCAPRREHRP